MKSLLILLIQCAFASNAKNKEICDPQICEELGGTTIKMADLIKDLKLREKFCPIGHGMVRLADMPCCHVCGQQRDKQCSEIKPCDTTLRLECEYTNKKQKTGVCQPKPGRECWADDRNFASGDDFWPNCNTQCFCIDGGIACRQAKSSEPDCLPGENIIHQEARMDPPSQIFFREANEEHGIKSCSVQTTQWSPCSRTCGWGFSERVTNNNPECKLEKEIMLCKMRACEESLSQGSQLSRSSRYNPRNSGSRYSRRYNYANSRSKRQLEKCSIRKGGKVRAKRAEKSKIVFSGCASKKSVAMKYCPVCPTERCCPDMAPIDNQNNEKYKGFKVKDVAFKCRDGEILRKKIMIIRHCRCNADSCKPSSPYMFSRRRLTSDQMIH